MSKKYIIEFEDEPFVSNGEKLYRAKGFNSLVFDKYGLEKLTPLREDEDKIKVGDEVTDPRGNKYIVLSVYANQFLATKMFTVLSKSNNNIDSYCFFNNEEPTFKKTGKHYYKLAEALNEITS